MEGRHHLFGEEACRLECVAPEELHHEQVAAQRFVAFDTIDDSLGRAPDAVLSESSAHVPAIDLLGLFEMGLCGLFVGANDDDTLL